MGIYINGIELGVFKAAQFSTWADEGRLKRATLAEALAHKAGLNDYLVLVVWQNGPFDAAGVAFDDRERDYFLARDEPRPRDIYLATVTFIREIDPECADSIIQARKELA